VDFVSDLRSSGLRMFFVDAESKNFFVNGAEEIDFFLNFLCKFETRDCFKLFLSSFVDDSIY